MLSRAAINDTARARGTHIGAPPAALARHPLSGVPSRAPVAGGYISRDLAMSERPLLAVVDDSDSVRDSLPHLLKQVGFDVQAFESAEAFLEAGAAERARCLILDVGLPGMSGPELQQELGRQGRTLPIIFITAQGDPSLKPRLLAAGAAACLFKPFSDTALIEAVEAAVGTR